MTIERAEQLVAVVEAAVEDAGRTVAGMRQDFSAVAGAREWFRPKAIEPSLQSVDVRIPSTEMIEAGEEIRSTAAGAPSTFQQPKMPLMPASRDRTPGKAGGIPRPPLEADATSS